MNRKEDIRIKKTRQTFNKAFEELISQKPIEEISVNEICNHAGIRRATFYKHYNDKQDFLIQYIGALRIKYDAKPDTVSYLDATVDYYVNYAKKVIEYVDEHTVMINNMLGSTQLHVIIGLIAQKNFTDTLEKLQTNVDRGMVLPASTESCAAMLTGGIATVVFEWLMSGKNRNVDQLTEDVEVFVRNILQI
jgi:AcrR family transcriptional regulator